MIGWLASLASLLSCQIQELPWWLVMVGILIRTQLHTGLFIIGHDAMHVVLLPASRRWNDRLGALVLALYAALPYRTCRDSHWRHHRFSATALDPDFASSTRVSALGWYCQFMARYLCWRQMAGLLTLWSAMALAFSSVINVLLFCTLPLLLSSLQLFVFGTYLPHRRQRDPQNHSPDSLNFPTWLSLLACFHFGYHREHHENPGLAWHELPEAKSSPRPLAASWWAM